ncbi:hypothetical protein N7492_008354 [Penicillium capsulatum]|uniref:Autophagy-related protein 11 n=1 Tax=Penicillium capsulatum TaxID=69766 RepID=A0A9W9HQK5_9EURO|nr:hypothetical protein N7492_008354 [Penicillium capsulatum]KAJ6105757.1 hypothetical protein N7512_009274 [Penicillium capsulatum]
MSLHIYVAHSGEHLLADPVAFTFPDALKSWILGKTSIPPARQILMTARGKNVKTQTLATETEIFVYDRQYVSEPGDVKLPELPAPEPFQPSSPPASLTNQNDLQAWRNLFMMRRKWANDLFTRCGKIDKAMREHNERTDVINRAVGVALENLKSHVGNLEHRFQEAQSWANNLLEEQQVALDGWQRALETLENIPARKDVPLLGRPSTPKKDKDRPTGTLRDFVDANEVLQAGTDAATLSPRFANHIQDIENAVSGIASDTQRFLEEVLLESTEEEDILLEAETFAKKIESDYEHVLSLPSNQKVLVNISRLALNHTQNLLPSLQELSGDLQQGLLRAVQRRSSTEKAALQHMRTISLIESRLADSHSRLVNLDVDGNAFDVIYSVFQMPMIYGSILIESVRRREWSDKIKTDSLTLAEEMAVLRDEEQRRRKKWVRSMGDCISFGDSTTPGIEVNLQGQDDEWPEVNRKEIEAYIEDLRTKHSLPNIAEDLSQQFKELDSPTRQQRRRAKAFKEGSVFDLSRSSMLLRGDGATRSLQEEKTKLEEKLKGSESRIRKLEDLLHRQSHLSRPSSGTFGPDFPTSPASPHPDALSRRSSVSSRRVSMTQSPEDRALVQRIVALEAELAGERETVQRMQKEAHVERQSNSDKYQEAQSTKKDLIGNLEARQREFEDERRYLEAESRKFKLRVEEMEEEMDRLMDREHEKQEAEERIHQLEVELETAHTNAIEEARKGSDLESRIQSQQSTEKDLQTKIDGLESQCQEWDQKSQDYYNALQSVFMHLSSGGSVPTELPGIIKAIEVLAEGLAIHARSAEDSASKAMADNKTLEEKINQLESELEGQMRTSNEREAEISHIKEETSQLQAQLLDSNTELDQERSKLASLRSQLSAGESGSDELRERVAESERKHTDLSQQLADAQSQLKDRQEEWEKKLDAASDAEQQILARFNRRGLRSHDLSTQLYSQVEKLGKMLEQLGFAIIQQDGQLVAQRVSKLSASSSLGESLAQSGIVSIKLEPALLNWVQAESEDDEGTKFSAFMESLAQFDVSIFGDAIVKRMKDIEVFARKYQKEARGYRDKYHRVQNEAHDKIAYRSFKEGDLALFLPTRNQAIRSWAAFNVGAPHYFLREQDSHKLNTRDWLLARITKVEERVVDLSKSLNGFTPDRRSIGDVSDNTSFEDDNPFELSDGLRWYLVDATEEKPGAPATPGIAKSTVASARVDAKGSIRLKRPTDEGTVAQTLSKSLDSRRNSSNSKRGSTTPSIQPNDSAIDLVRPADTDADPSSQPREAAPIFDEVRRDLLLGP